MKSMIALALMVCLVVPATAQEWIRVNPLGARRALPEFTGFVPNIDLLAQNGYLRVVANDDPLGLTVPIYIPLPIPNGSVIDSIGFYYFTTTTTSIRVGLHKASSDFTPNLVWEDPSWHTSGGSIDSQFWDTPELSAADGTLSLKIEYDPEDPYFLINDIQIKLIPETTGVGDDVSAAPRVLEQNYPNPFNPSTTLAFDLPVEARIELRIYDAGGALVRRLLDHRRGAGRHEIAWDGLDDAGLRVSSGAYFYELSYDGHREARKMILVK